MARTQEATSKSNGDEKLKEVDREEQKVDTEAEKVAGNTMRKSRKLTARRTTKMTHEHKEDQRWQGR